MSIRHLQQLLEPASVVVIGAPDRPGSVGTTVWRNLRAGTFKGVICGVNPSHATLDGVTVYPRVADLPIAADLHDDLGAKLLTIVHTSESERISTLAREALEEMRLSVRGLTGKPVRLADALGDWRAEVISRLGQAGIDGEWDGPEDLPQTLSARTYVQTTRILREATSNVIKHSGASACTITARIADGDFQLMVQDNGDGISDPIEGRLDRGHGLASMKNRAKQLQGQCLVESSAGYGTVIRLTLPLDRATRAS